MSLFFFYHFPFQQCEFEARSAVQEHHFYTSFKVVIYKEMSQVSKAVIKYVTEIRPLCQLNIFLSILACCIFYPKRIIESFSLFFLQLFVLDLLH